MRCKLDLGFSARTVEKKFWDLSLGVEVMKMEPSDNMPDRRCIPADPVEILARPSFAEFV
jgi:hypothetical protein